MPLYEYKCEGCGDVFEVMQKFTDEPLTVHAKCGGPVHRLISAPALQFKGSGWYITDYAKSNGSSKESSTSNSDTTTKAENKSESKSETKSESSKTGSSNAPAPSKSD